MITREHAIWAYRLFLDREPENEDVITERVTGIGNTRELRANFILSREFGENNQELVLTGETNIVIKEIGQGLRLFVDLSDHVIGWGITRGAYEQKEINYVRRTVKPSQTVLDIGAHIGLFTVIMAETVGSGGKVHAFEPLASHVSLLTRSVNENGFNARVVIEQAAVSETHGKGQLITPWYTVNSGGAYLDTTGLRAVQGHVTKSVDLIKLDNYPLRRPVSFIKIDIEGAEPLALRGAAELLRTDRPIILSELHPAQLERVSRYSPDRFISEMDSYGYNCYSLGEDGLVPFATRNTTEVGSIVFLPKEGG